MISMNNKSLIFNFNNKVNIDDNINDNISLTIIKQNSLGLTNFLT